MNFNACYTVNKYILTRRLTNSTIKLPYVFLPSSSLHFWRGVQHYHAQNWKVIRTNLADVENVSVERAQFDFLG